MVVDSMTIGITDSTLVHSQKHVKMKKYCHRERSGLNALAPKGLMLLGLLFIATLSFEFVSADHMTKCFQKGAIGIDSPSVWNPNGIKSHGHQDGACNTVLESVDNDWCGSIYFGGYTTSKKLIWGLSITYPVGQECTTQKYGFIKHFVARSGDTDYGTDWEKYFPGVGDTHVPWLRIPNEVFDTSDQRQHQGNKFIHQGIVALLRSSGTTSNFAWFVTLKTTGNLDWQSAPVPWDLDGSPNHWKNIYVSGRVFSGKVMKKVIIGYMTGHTVWSENLPRWMMYQFESVIGGTEDPINTIQTIYKDPSHTIGFSLTSAYLFKNELQIYGGSLKGGSTMNNVTDTQYVWGVWFISLTNSWSKVIYCYKSGQSSDYIPSVDHIYYTQSRSNERAAGTRDCDNQDTDNSIWWECNKISFLIAFRDKTTYQVVNRNENNVNLLLFTVAMFDETGKTTRLAMDNIPDDTKIIRGFEKAIKFNNMNGDFWIRIYTMVNGDLNLYLFGSVHKTFASWQTGDFVDKGSGAQGYQKMFKLQIRKHYCTRGDQYWKLFKHCTGASGCWGGGVCDLNQESLLTEKGEWTNFKYWDPECPANNCTIVSMQLSKREWDVDDTLEFYTTTSVRNDGSPSINGATNGQKVAAAIFNSKSGAQFKYWDGTNGVSQTLNQNSYGSGTPANDANDIGNVQNDVFDVTLISSTALPTWSINNKFDNFNISTRNYYLLVNQTQGDIISLVQANWDKTFETTVGSAPRIGTIDSTSNANCGTNTWTNCDPTLTQNTLASFTPPKAQLIVNANAMPNYEIVVKVPSPMTQTMTFTFFIVLEYYQHYLMSWPFKFTWLCQYNVWPSTLPSNSTITDVEQQYYYQKDDTEDNWIDFDINLMFGTSDVNECFTSAVITGTATWLALNPANDQYITDQPTNKTLTNTLIKMIKPSLATAGTQTLTVTINTNVANNAVLSSVTGLLTLTKTIQYVVRPTCAETSYTTSNTSAIFIVLGIGDAYQANLTTLLDTYSSFDVATTTCQIKWDAFFSNTSAVTSDNTKQIYFDANPHGNQYRKGLFYIKDTFTTGYLYVKVSYRNLHLTVTPMDMIYQFVYCGLANQTVTSITGQIVLFRLLGSDSGGFTIPAAYSAVNGNYFTFSEPLCLLQTTFEIVELATNVAFVPATATVSYTTTTLTINTNVEGFGAFRIKHQSVLGTTNKIKAYQTFLYSVCASNTTVPTIANISTGQNMKINLQTLITTDYVNTCKLCKITTFKLYNDALTTTEHNYSLLALNPFNIAATPPNYNITTVSPSFTGPPICLWLKAIWNNTNCTTLREPTRICFKVCGAEVITKVRTAPINVYYFGVQRDVIKLSKSDFFNWQTNNDQSNCPTQYFMSIEKNLIKDYKWFTLDPVTGDFTIDWWRNGAILTENFTGGNLNLTNFTSVGPDSNYTFTVYFLAVSPSSPLKNNTISITMNIQNYDSQYANDDNLEKYGYGNFTTNFTLKINESEMANQTSLITIFRSEAFDFEADQINQTVKIDRNNFTEGFLIIDPPEWEYNNQSIKYIMVNRSAAVKNKDNQTYVFTFKTWDNFFKKVTQRVTNLTVKWIDPLPPPPTPKEVPVVNTTSNETNSTNTTTPVIVVGPSNQTNATNETSTNSTTNSTSTNETANSANSSSTSSSNTTENTTTTNVTTTNSSTDVTEKEKEEAKVQPAPAVSKEEEKKSQPQVTKGASTMGAGSNPFAKKIDEKVLLDLFKVEAPKNKTQNFKVEQAEDVMLKIKEVSRSGLITVAFNQKLVLPPFVQNAEKETLDQKVTRKLVALKDIPVQNYIFDFKFVSNDENSEDTSKITYYAELREWTEEQLVVFCNFSDPNLISRGNLEDQLIVEVKNRDMFISQQSGQKIKTTYKYIQKPMPRQLPKGVDEEALKAAAESAKNTAYALMITQVCMQACMKGALNDLWNLYFTLQIICYLTIYDINFPANSEIYLQQFISLIEFDILKPDKIIQNFVDPEFTYARLFKGKSNETNTIETNKDQKKNVMDDLMLYAIIAAVFLLFVGCLCVLRIYVNIRKKIEAKIMDIKKKMLFNGVIRSVLVGYLFSGISASRQIKQFMKGSIFQKPEDIYASFAQLGFLTIFPLVLVIIIHKNQFVWNWKIEGEEEGKSDDENESKKEPTEKSAADIMMSVQRSDKSGSKSKKKKKEEERALKNQRLRDFNQKFSILTDDISFYRSYLAHMYWPIFLIRRVIFVSIPCFVYFWPFFQIQTLLLFTTFYLVLYGNARPHNSVRTSQELFNEVMVMICNYHMIAFSDFNLNMETQYYMGYSFVACVGLVILFNVSILIRNLLVKVFRKFALKRLKSGNLVNALLQIKELEKQGIIDIQMSEKRHLYKFSDLDNMTTEELKEARKKIMKLIEYREVNKIEASNEILNIEYQKQKEIEAAKKAQSGSFFDMLKKNKTEVIETKKNPNALTTIYEEQKEWSIDGDEPPLEIIIEDFDEGKIEPSKKAPVQAEKPKKQKRHKKKNAEGPATAWEDLLFSSAEEDSTENQSEHKIAQKREEQPKPHNVTKQVAPETRAKQLPVAAQVVMVAGQLGIPAESKDITHMGKKKKKKKKRVVQPVIDTPILNELLGL